MPPKRGKIDAPPPVRELSTEELEEEVARRLAPSAFPLGEPCVGPARDRVFVRVGARLEAPWVSGDLRFGFPVHTWDSWMVLGALAAEPVAKNRDGTIPQKWLKPVASKFVPVPEWWGMGSHPEQRTFSAFQHLDSLGALARQRGEVTGWAKYTINTKGSLLHRGGRVAFFQEVLAGEHLSVLDLSTDQMHSGLREAVVSALWLLRSCDVHDPGLGRMVKRRLLESLPADGSAVLKDVREAFGPRDPWIPDPTTQWSERKIEVSMDEVLDRIHQASSERILSHAVSAPYLHGLICRGVAPDGSFTMGLTDAGRRFLGLPPGLGAPAVRHAKVTAAYDVVFGRMDPAALSELSLYAQLTGTDHGLVGKITRASIQSAFSLGIAVSEIVASLETMASHPLPGNVKTALEDWARVAQPVKVREGVLLECPDEDTAGILERMGKGATERVGPTMVFLTDRKSLGALRKKASESGILI
ncbi:MAG: helicase-associated domain-containing protein [Fibrobacterota bacterium]|nr:helicase-associated domain-containing protein [Fibrobacterota bacterium]QQS07529.1 MAG: helicase-associated domain-containing protein [Fibrobacterota bacterium]